MRVWAWVRIAADPSWLADAGVVHDAERPAAPLMAAYVVGATTATAFPSGTTAVAPAGTAGVPLSVAPIAGAFLMAANTIPGTRTSMP